MLALRKTWTFPESMVVLRKVFISLYFYPYQKLRLIVMTQGPIRPFTK